eukprot:TRINITY_DN13410_c0_g1_i2.p1 TRINITY_DN13410_c0_g1~~TRINITY_DN13410_c0_g1_i2.p1  ORF type:complete len:711 (-),score=56.03 TRINITY_DN13410_c0_g1_i2:37-2169(-)
MLPGNDAAFVQALNGGCFSTSVLEDSSRISNLENRVAALEAILTEHDNAPIQASVVSQEKSQHSFLHSRSTVLAQHHGDVDGVSIDLVDNCDAKAPSDFTNEMEAQAEARGSDSADREDEYFLADSVWDAALVVGVQGVSRSDSAFLLLYTLLNVAIQGFVCFTLITNADFVPHGSWSRYKSVKFAMQRWLLTDGHSLVNLDLGDRSLVTRVCENDASLSLGLRQANLLSAINSYFGVLDSASEITDSSYFTRGPLISVMCMFYYILVVLKDMRHVTHSIFALAALPRANHTLVVSNAVLSLSFGRFVWSLFVVIVRVAVAGLLLAAGMIWLAVTNQISQLILNTAALSFVLELDDLIFHAMLPSTLQNFVTGMQPLKFKRFPWKSRAALPLFVTILLIFAVCRTVMVENIHDMLVIRKELCGGFKEFVSTKDPNGLMWSRKTANSSFHDVMDRYELQAVREMSQADNPGVAASFNFTQWTMDVIQFEIRASSAGAAPPGPCLDYSDSPYAPLFSTALRSFLNNMVSMVRQRYDSVFPEEFSCSGYRAVCSDYTLMRSLCPVTCGCATGTSGLLVMGPPKDKGCPAECNALVQEQLDNAACLDLPVVTQAPQDAAIRLAWTSYWNSLQHIFAIYFPKDVNRLTPVADAMRASGCNGTLQNPMGGRTFCEGDEGFLFDTGIRSIVAFCPYTCCHKSGPAAGSHECPPSCSL